MAGPFDANALQEKEPQNAEYEEALRKARFCLHVGGYFNYDEMTQTEVAAFTQVHNEIVAEQNKANKKK